MARRDGESGFSLVELLVVILILGIVTTAITSVIISATRAERFTSDVREVMDDARRAMDSMRRDIRAARRVLPTSSAAAGRLHIWVDQDQDRAVQASELMCFATRSFGPNQWEIVRWSGTSAATNCTTPPSDARLLLRTLRNSTPFVLTPTPSVDPGAEATRLVVVNLDLDSSASGGPDTMTFTATMRLRNVE